MTKCCLIFKDMFFFLQASPRPQCSLVSCRTENVVRVDLSSLSVPSKVYQNHKSHGSYFLLILF
jgi:hypothetical protein